MSTDDVLVPVEVEWYAYEEGIEDDEETPSNIQYDGGVHCGGERESIALCNGARPATGNQAICTHRPSETSSRQRRLEAKERRLRCG